MRRIYYVIILTVTFCVTSCGPASKIRRAERLIAKAEELGAKWHVDSVQVNVPVIVPETRVDSVFVQKPGDTVIITKDRLQVKIMRWQADTIRVQAECAADTIYTTVTKTVTKTLEAKGGLKWWWLIVAAAAGMILGAVLRLVT